MAANQQVTPLRPSIRLSPAHSRDNSRSTSPERIPGSLYPKIDPLLSNLSPESTLHALTSTEAVPANGDFSHLLSQSISQVSPAERALGIRAAIAARNLNLWHKEVQAWAWPKVNEAAAGKGFIPPASFLDGLGSPLTDTGVTYYGSLPAQVVEEYEKRIEEIRDGMESLDVDELKEHVLNAHIPSRSRPSSSTSTVSVPPPLSYVQLSDFTAIVTATILRALPYLARLNHLLTIWEVRLLVLRHIPGLLRELQSTRFALNTSSSSIQSSNVSEDVEARFSSSYLRDQHVQLESAVIAVGKRMDRALDALEGRNDSLPEQWIDDLESIESDFAVWVVETERYKLRTEWLRAKDQSKSTESCEESKPSSHEDFEKKLDVEPVIAPVKSEPDQIAPMENLGEEARLPFQPAQSTDCHIREQPDQHSTPPVDTGLTIVTSGPEASLGRVLESCPRAETNEKPESRSNVLVAEDLETPTQSTFLRGLSLGTPEVQSPSRIPMPVSPDVENKENIPPQGFVPQQSSSVRESGAKPAVLGEHKDEDPFAQKRVPHDVPESEQEPSTADTAPVAPRQEALLGGEGLQNEAGPDPKEEINEDLTKSAEHVPNDVNTVTKALPVEKPTQSAIDEEEKPTLESPATPAEPSRDTIKISSTKPTPQQPGITKSRIPKPLPARATSPPAPIKEHVPEQQAASKKKPLQSPIKLSKARQGNPSHDKGSPKPRFRRPSTGSVGSFLSDSSLASPRPTEPHTGSSNGELRREFTKSVSPHGDYMLRADRLRRLEDIKMSANPAFQASRSVSLPLQRFINEKLDLDLSTESVPEIPERFKSKNSVIPGNPGIPVVSSTPAQTPHVPRRRPALVRGKSASDLKNSDTSSNPPDRSLPAFGGNTARRAMQHQDQPKSARLRQRLTAHPSLESLGVKKQELSYVEEDESELMDSGSRSSTPNKLSKKPKDQLDEKINSILSTLPGRIHLVDPNNEADSSSSSSSMDRKMRERYLSESPHGPPSRSFTPAPSLTLMPAARRRLSHAHKTEDSYVKLYHLHHGGQTAPTKLFVRTVGEDGQRVMVRVGGGWADLGEYLREYVVHHGRRKVSETPRVEVQGLPTRSSPGYSSPANLLPPAAPSLNSGRATPSRPASVLSVRPPSSLTVRKSRRDSTASEAVAPRSVTTGNLSSFTSPPSAGGPGRRLSMSSSYSFGDFHSPAQLSLQSHDNSTPLGLAGPKPRSRQISMSPEGEAWVENVLQKTRRSTSFNPSPFDSNHSLGIDEADHYDLPHHDHTGRPLPKVRSIGDISIGGTGRRVVLRGLGNHR
ncbi:hypothetical protein N7451_005481 [Penicillium sp. IBT 35674x]|nr:hypothetical protein N7451_005481 [Penicillium sp. IBT 35674x]